MPERCTAEQNVTPKALRQQLETFILKYQADAAPNPFDTDVSLLILVAPDGRELWLNKVIPGAERGGHFLTYLGVTMYPCASPQSVIAQTDYTFGQSGANELYKRVVDTEHVGEEKLSCSTSKERAAHLGQVAREITQSLTRSEQIGANNQLVTDYDEIAGLMSLLDNSVVRRPQ